MTLWTDQDPGAGDFEGLASRKSRLAAQRDHATSMQQAFSRAASGAGEIWAGGGHDAWATRAASTAAGWGRLHTWADSEYQALSRYEADVESIAASAARQKAILSEAGLTLLKASGISTTISTSSHFTETSATDPARDDAQAAAAAANRALTALAKERQEADHRVTASIRIIRETYLGTPTPTMPAGLTESGLNRLTPQQLLSTLTALTSEDLRRLAGADPSLAARLQQADPRVVASWWKSLGKAQQDSFATHGSILIGNLEGVDYTHRDIANRAVLASEGKRLQAAHQMLSEHLTYLNLTATDSSVMQSDEWLTTEAKLARDAATMRVISSVEKTLAQGSRSVPRQVVTLEDIDNNPRVAISVGDLDTADHVSYLVPGMNTNVVNNMPGWTTAATNLYVEQNRALLSSGTVETVATVSWVGYTTPDSSSLAHAADVTRGDLAEAGGKHLATALNGMCATRAWGAENSHLAVVAHSYGTTTAADALTEASAGQFVMLGSAGVELRTTDKLKVPAAQVYASQGVHDGWAGIGQVLSHRVDPTTKGFGAHVFSSETTGTGASQLHGITQHGPLVNGKSHPDSYSYLDRNTESIHNTALASLGMGTHVPVYSAPPPVAER